MLLLHIYQQLAREGRLSCEPVVFHLDHSVRPESADDADFVLGRARGAGFPAYLETRSAIDFARRARMSVEEAGRTLRYRALARLADRFDSAYAVTAHHADDYLESVLIHLIRGGGPAALSTMPPVAQVEGVLVFRPMLSLLREEIERYAAQIEWREDKTNASRQYLRNRIRQDITPKLREEGLNPARLWELAHDREIPGDGSTAKTAHHIRLDRSLLRSARMPDIKSLLDLSLKAMGLHPASREMCLAVFRARSGRLRFRSREAQIWAAEDGPVHLFRNDSPLFRPAQVVSGGDEIAVRYADREQTFRGPDLRMATFRPGMRVRIRDGEKKLKKVFQEQGVPLPVRAYLPLLVDPAGLVVRVCLSFLGERDLFF